MHPTGDNSIVFQLMQIMLLTKILRPVSRSVVNFFLEGHVFSRLSVVVGLKPGLLVVEKLYPESGN